MGYLSIDTEYHRALAMVKLVYSPILEEGVTWTFHEIYNLGDSNSVAFSPDGRYLATDATLWKVDGGKKIHQFEVNHNVNAVSFSPDGKYLAIGDPRYVTLWEVNSGRKIWQRQESYQYQPWGRYSNWETAWASFNAVSFSPDGKYLATSDTRNVTLWNVSDGKAVWQRQESYQYQPWGRYSNWETAWASFNAVSFNPDGRYLATGNSHLGSGTVLNKVILWEGGRKVRQMAHSGGVSVMSFSPSGKYLATGDTHNATLWDADSGTKIWKIEHKNNVNAIAFSPNGKYLAIGGSDRAITFYRIPTNITIETDITTEAVIQVDDIITDLAWNSYGNLISDGKKVYRTLLKPEIYDVEKPVKPTGPDKHRHRLEGPLNENIPIAIRRNPAAVAVVIGIQDYLSPTVPSVQYAKRDAQLVREYLIKTFGYDEYNILPRDPNQLMTVGNLKTLIKQQLPDYVKKNGTSDVFIYYAGHGAPSTETQEAFLAPYDFNPNVDVNTYNAYRLKDLYADLLKIECQSLTIVLDTCFSGMTGDGQVLIQNISPVILPKLEISKQVLLSHPKAVVLTSTSNDRVSNWYPEKKHSLFTYFFLKGLQGAADKNSDNRITVGELETYLLDENNGVPYWAKRLFSRSQTPQVHSMDKSIIIVDVKR